MNEAETRRQIVDGMLHLAGWNLTDPSQVVTELDLFLATKGGRGAEYHPSYGIHQIADYGLMLKSKPGLVLETKRTSKDAENGQEQGLQYAQRAQALYGGALPFVMYSNGHDTYFWESDFYPPVKAYGVSAVGCATSATMWCQGSSLPAASAVRRAVRLAIVRLQEPQRKPTIWTRRTHL